MNGAVPSGYETSVHQWFCSVENSLQHEKMLVLQSIINIDIEFNALD
jgi:hypothetical protein